MTKYIALKAIQITDEAGVRRSVEPKSAKHSGLFEHTFDSTAEKRLIDARVIRLPEGVEQHDDLTPVEAMYDRRVVESTATDVVEKKTKVGRGRQPAPPAETESLIDA